MARLGLMFGAVAIVLAGCSQFAKQSGLNRSLATWNALKAENGNHYLYEVSASVIAGPTFTTTLTVQDETVVMRNLEVSEISGTGEKTVIDSWTEEGAAVGSHDEGAEPVTLDARYNTCRSDVLSRSSLTNDIILEFQANGVLASCYSLPKGVVYDGGAEVVTNLEFLKND